MNLCNYVGSSNPMLVNALFGAVNLTENNNFDKYKYSGYGIEFDMTGTFSVANGFGKNIITFDADMRPSVYIDNKKNDILILGKDPTQGLDVTTLTAEKLYSISFTEHDKKFCLNLHYNGANSYLFVYGAEIIKFKAKDSRFKRC